MHYLSQLIFLDKELKLQSSVSNRCHEGLMVPANISSIAILNIYGVDYGYIIFGINRNETIKFIKIYRFELKR